MPEFIAGLKLSEMFYKEAVGPILDRHWPRLKHSAALIGYGSDVLGFGALIESIFGGLSLDPSKNRPSP